MRTWQGIPSRIYQNAKRRRYNMLKAGKNLIPAGKLADVYGSRNALSRIHPNFYLSFKINNLFDEVFFA
ncbi:hypothetical protein TH468_17260 [Thalassospira sp. MCCC 1A03138]|nr:hypothetical protein TH468_17260 [Thalassospira sp. MCCC 1A03138]